jgi:DNA-binding NarL/FixJ family response regulator
VKKLNVLIVEDETLLREGFRSLLVKEDFVKSVAEATTREEFHKALEGGSIDLILLDIRLADVNGLELISEVQNELKPKIIAVTGLEGAELIINLLKAGVEGIVHKLDGYDEVRRAVMSTMDTGSYFTERVTEIIRSHAHHWDKTPSVLLNYHEKELLQAIAKGLTTKQIAAELKMAQSTAETYRLRLIKKIGVPNTAALLAFAFRNGIL